MMDIKEWKDIDGKLEDENFYKISVYLDQADVEDIIKLQKLYKLDKSRIVRIALRSMFYRIKKGKGE